MLPNFKHYVDTPQYIPCSFKKASFRKVHSRWMDGSRLFFPKRLVKSHICSSIPVTLDPLQFAYRPNRSTDDAISHILHSSLTHIDSSNGSFARLLFIDYSSAFNTIVPIKLASKLTDLGLNSSLFVTGFRISSPADLKW